MAESQVFGKRMKWRGLVEQALRKTFGSGAGEPPRETPPRYWRDRFSNAACLLETPLAGPGAAAQAEIKPWDAAFLRHLLPRQQGGAASFLAARPG
jgi:hypothetical protein